MTHLLILVVCALGVIFGSGPRVVSASAALNATLEQTPAKVDVTAIGPQVGAVAPAFGGTDQTGATRSLKSVAGPKGTMLVFFRSADW